MISRVIKSLLLVMLLAAAFTAQAVQVQTGAEIRPRGMPTDADKEAARLQAYREGLIGTRSTFVGPEVPAAAYEAVVNSKTLPDIEKAITSKRVLREPKRKGYYAIEMLVDFDADLVKQWFASAPPRGKEPVQRERLMVVIHESGDSQTSSEAAAEKEIIRALIAGGYEVVSEQQVTAIRDRDLLVQQALSGNPRALVATATEFGSDLLVFGEASSHPVERSQALGANMFPARGSVSVTMVATDTGAVLHSDSAEAGSIDLSPAVAGTKAVREAAGTIAADLLAALDRQSLTLQIIVTGVSEQQNEVLRAALLNQGLENLAQVSLTAGDRSRFSLHTNKSTDEVAAAFRATAPTLGFQLKQVDLSARRLVYEVPAAAAAPIITAAPFVPPVAGKPRPPQAAAPAEGINLLKEKWKALLIGINDYSETPFDSLATPRSDVEELAAMLRDNYGFASVETVLDNEGTFRGLRRALSDFVESVGPNDNVLIYYAGHGYLQPSGLGVWITADAQDAYDGMSNAEIREHVANMTARRVLLVSDSCYSGDFLSRALGSVTYETLADDTTEAVAISNAIAGNQMSAREVITSGNLNPVPDRGQGACSGHSPFACILLQTLQSVPRGGVIGTTDLYGQIWLGMKNQGVAATEGPQRGQLPGHNGGEFFLVRRN